MQLSTSWATSASKGPKTCRELVNAVRSSKGVPTVRRCAGQGAVGSGGGEVGVAVAVGSGVVPVGTAVVDVVGSDVVEVLGSVVGGAVDVGSVAVGSVGTLVAVEVEVGTSVAVGASVAVTAPVAVGAAVGTVVVGEALGSKVTSDRGGTAGGMTIVGAGARSR